jgi:hypothetical protein
VDEVAAVGGGRVVQNRVSIAEIRFLRFSKST